MHYRKLLYTLNILAVLKCDPFKQASTSGNGRMYAVIVGLRATPRKGTYPTAARLCRH